MSTELFLRRPCRLVTINSVEQKWRLDLWSNSEWQITKLTLPPWWTESPPPNTYTWGATLSRQNGEKSFKIIFYILIDGWRCLDVSKNTSTKTQHEWDVKQQTLLLTLTSSGYLPKCFVLRCFIEKLTEWYSFECLRSACELKVKMDFS